MRETWFWFLGWKHPLEEGMATDSRTPVCLLRESPWTEEPGGLQPLGHKELDTTEWLNIAQHKLDVPVQFSSVTQSCLTLCSPMDCSTPGLPVHQQLPEFTQTHVHWVSYAIWIPILYCPLLLPPSMSMRAFQVVLVVKNLCANAGDLRDTDLLPG